MLHGRIPLASLGVVNHSLLYVLRVGAPVHVMPKGTERQERFVGFLKSLSERGFHNLDSCRTLWSRSVAAMPICCDLSCGIARRSERRFGTSYAHITIRHGHREELPAQHTGKRRDEASCGPNHDRDASLRTSPPSAGRRALRLGEAPSHTCTFASPRDSRTCTARSSRTPETSPLSNRTMAARGFATSADSAFEERERRLARLI